MFYDDFIKACAADYPATEDSVGFAARLAPTLVSPHILELPATLLEQAREIVRAFFQLRQTPEWQKHSLTQEPPLNDPGNTSVLMSYDFHVDGEGALRLIEINTNASLSLVVDELYRVHGMPSDFRPKILDAFAQEAREAGREIKTIAIVDEKPREQRLFIEFAMYQELFKERGWKANFYDPSELACVDGVLRANDGTPIDLVYNRDTDFYFTKPESKSLDLAMREKCAVITPHPYEYRLLGDKDRLLELSRMTDLPSALSRSLIRTREVKDFDPEELRKDRKRWFFKPRRSHGGKAVYRGSSTSRGVFDSIIAGDYLAQELVPPPVAMLKGEDTSTDEFKYDLRFYVYRDEIQLACARLYRGQMTNAQTPGGGVAPIRWT